MERFLNGLNYARNERKRSGITAFEPKQPEWFRHHYDELIAIGYEANQSTRGKLAKKVSGKHPAGKCIAKSCVL